MQPELNLIDEPSVDVGRPSAAVVTGWFRSTKLWPSATMHGPRGEFDRTGAGSGSANAPSSPVALVCGIGSQV